ncbi:hypothetical protein D9611_003071 [Ephemerocybe angulata]|uniref:F-box domain-containing protein n=1 Tax=Ephemerocybe angulata TaxID=980116 RepID=A0A8H5C822_9AGAR|nr:hypothetical protein D9611_003071 [Tulosesus angulatus]
MKTNIPPTDEEREQLTSGLRYLEANYLRLTGVAYAARLPGDQGSHKLSWRAKKCHEAIRAHKSVLSCIRTVPEDVWQQIFAYVIALPDDRMKHHRVSHDALIRICKVAGLWRSAAVNYCPLWTTLPPITINKCGYSTSNARDEQQKTNMYLARSGTTLPISFQLFVRFPWGPTQKEIASFKSVLSDMMATLINQCHRWETVHLTIPDFLTGQLGLIHGKLPRLSALYLSLLLLDLEDKEILAPKVNVNLTPIDCFSDAPSLRHAETHLDTVSQHTRTCARAESPIVILPWSQLECFASKGVPDTALKAIIEAQPQNLKKIRYNANYGSPPQSAPSFLPQLEELIWVDVKYGISRATAPAGSPPHLAAAASQFNHITTPNLTKLIIQQYAAYVDEIGPAVRDLIYRSFCSLQSLYLDSIDPQSREFFDIILLSPQLQHLGIPHTWGSTLRFLVLDPFSLNPVLPKLKTLWIRSFIWSGRLFASSDANFSMNAVCLYEMVWSRTEALDSIVPSRYFPHHKKLQRLEEVRLLGYDADAIYSEWTELQAFKGDAPAEGRVQSDHVDRIAKQYAFGKESPAIKKCFRQKGRSRTMRGQIGALFNAFAHKRLDALMREVEAIDLKKYTSHELIRRRIPYILAELGGNFKSRFSFNIIPGNILYGFRRRARNLLAKWKPFLIQDFRARRYLWMSYPPHDWLLSHLHPVCILKCQPPESIEDDATIWRHMMTAGGHWFQEGLFNTQSFPDPSPS